MCRHCNGRRVYRARALLCSRTRRISQFCQLTRRSWQRLPSPRMTPARSPASTDELARSRLKTIYCHLIAHTFPIQLKWTHIELKLTHPTKLFAPDSLAAHLTSSSSHLCLGLRRNFHTMHSRCVIILYYYVK